MPHETGILISKRDSNENPLSGRFNLRGSISKIFKSGKDSEFAVVANDAGIRHCW
jgi:hypothetical protein